VGVAHLQAASLIQVRDQSLRICHIQAEGVPNPSAKAEEEGHKRSVEGCPAWGALAGNPGPLDKIRSGTTDKPLFGRVSVNTLDLVCRTRGYSPDIQFYAPLDGHTDIRPRPSSTRTSRTTNILASAEGCIRAEIHRHRLSYKAHATSVCKQSPNALYPEGGWEVVSVVGSFGATVSCAVVGITKVREDNP